MDNLFNATRFGEKLKKYRLKKHLSQMELAEKNRFADFFYQSS